MPDDLNEHGNYPPPNQPSHVMLGVGFVFGIVLIMGIRWYLR
ncbi:hypothetical protein SAMN04515648_3447 [Phyllobacterium sp. CL33Tsu]|nr:hypothetical protein SAMN04515648_3447 [Phyllobacterium sp. CL33Tsu]